MPAVAIVGLGLMGSSLALALKEAQPDTVVVGSDPDAMTLRKALDRGIVESASADLSIIGVADMVVVAVPILALKNVFSNLRGRVDGKVVTDMASTKETVLEWAAASGLDLVGGHPMCGKEAFGIDNADGSIFKGAPWVLMRDDRAVMALVESVGAHPLVMDAAIHDRLVAGVSHAAFLLSVGYVLSLSSRSDWPEASKLAASGFRDMSRLAGGDPGLYAGISRTNRDNLVEQLDAISATLAKLRRHLQDNDPRLVELFEDAKSVRERWAHDMLAN